MSRNQLCISGAIVSVAAFCGMLSGCSMSYQNASSPVSSTGRGLHGGVRGGQQPVSGARLYLFAAGVTGYTSAPTSLLQGAGVTVDGSGNGYVQTGQDGSFVITGDYVCPSPDSQVYLEAMGGNPGLTGTVNNPSIALVAALGSCSALTSATFIQINEISTAVAAFGLAHFANIDATKGSTADAFATSSANVTGLKNAFATIANIEDLTTGYPRTTTLSGTGQVDVATIDSLANVLASCVNTNGSGGTCASLMSLSTVAGGTAPTDTLQAAVNIVLNPTNNFTQLAALQSATPPFQPTFTPAVGYVLAVTYPNMPVGASPAFDSQGNLWTTSAGSLYKISGTGAPLSGANGFALTGTASENPTLAIDTQDNVWVTNPYNNGGSVFKFSNSGALLSPAGGFTGGGLRTPLSIAIDGSNNAWVVNYAAPGPALSEFASDGSPIRTVGTTSPPNLPTGIGIDGAGDVWISECYGVDSCSPSVEKLDGSGNPLAGSPFSIQFGGDATSITFDAQGDGWFTGNGNGLVGEATSNGTSLPLPAATLGYGDTLVVDGNNVTWVASQFQLEPLQSDRTPNLSFVLRPTNPNRYALLDRPVVDGVGNLWINRGGWITEYVGLAGPITTPTALAVKNNAFGRRP